MLLVLLLPLLPLWAAAQISRSAASCIFTAWITKGMIGQGTLTRPNTQRGIMAPLARYGETIMDDDARSSARADELVPEGAAYLDIQLDERSSVIPTTVPSPESKTMCVPKYELH